MILIIDNYDSFTFNLHQFIGEVLEDKSELKVYRNDAITIDNIRTLRPTHIVLSPGPCSPNEAGMSLEIVSRLGKDFPILGVCLGHQCIGQAYGGVVTRAQVPMHGKVSNVEHNSSWLYRGCPSPFQATRYHSLIVDRQSLPDSLEITAWSEQGEIMGLAHKLYPQVQGVQFHPESIMTKTGKQLLKNFLTFGRN